MTRSVFGWAALVAAAMAFAGFARSYYLKPFFEAPELSTLVHVHAVLMTAWVLLFLAQVRLVASNRRDLHRKLGTAAIVLVVLVVAVGIQTAIVAARNGVGPDMPPLAFLAIPVSAAVAFAGFVLAALLYRHRPDYHKRLMVLAMFSVILPAIARLSAVASGVPSPPVAIALTVGIVVVFVAWDTARNRRLHPAFGWGAAIFIASMPLRVAIARSDAWMAVAHWMTGV